MTKVQLYLTDVPSSTGSEPVFEAMTKENVDGLRIPASPRSKEINGGRHIPLNPDLRGALIALAARYDGKPPLDACIAYSSKDIGLSAGSVTVWFHRLYARLGLRGASSHSGRRTFVTRLAKTIVAKGGSLRDVQQLTGHATTQGYIEGSSDAKRRAIEAL
jgi:integrase